MAHGYGLLVVAEASVEANSRPKPLLFVNSGDDPVITIGAVKALHEHRVDRAHSVQKFRPLRSGQQSGLVQNIPKLLLRKPGVQQTFAIESPPSLRQGPGSKRWRWMRVTNSHVFSKPLGAELISGHVVLPPGVVGHVAAGYATCPARAADVPIAMRRWRSGSRGWRPRVIDIEAGNRIREVSE